MDAYGLDFYATAMVAHTWCVVAVVFVRLVAVLQRDEDDPRYVAQEEEYNVYDYL